MCSPALLAPLLGGGAATAAGATAAAATAGAASGLASLGSILGIAGTLYSGISGMQAANANVAAMEDQKRTEAQLTATQDQRTRQKMASAIRQQNAELAGRGVELDSVTAMMLGQTAAQELSFESQSIRTTGAARQRELTANQREARARGASGLLKGIFSAAGDLVTAAPDLWPGFNRTERQLA